MRFTVCGVEKHTVFPVLWKTNKLRFYEGGRRNHRSSRFMYRKTTVFCLSPTETVQEKSEASVVSEGKDKKVIVYKYKRKTGYHKKNGHRQLFTQVKIDNIVG